MKKQETKIVLRKVPRKNSKRVLGIKLMYFMLFAIPLFTCLLIVSTHSNELITKALAIILLILDIIAVMVFILGFILYLVNPKIKTGRKVKTWAKVLAGVALVVYLTIGIGFTTLLYGPYEKFRVWLVTNAMTTMNHQYYATWFYGQEDLDRVFAENNIIESDEDTDPDLILFSKEDKKAKFYKNKYEEEILGVKEETLYQVINLDRNGYIGKLIAVYDPSLVELAISKGTGQSLTGSYGQMLTNMVEDNKAVFGINAGGFYDPDWNSSGGVPHGIVISKGKLIANNRKAGVGGGLVGFDDENRLILSRGISAKRALDIGIRDAVEFGPYLIVNGKPSFVKGNGGWGWAPRTVIGQREDGIVLLVVIDGRQKASKGADMQQLTQLMIDYGAINAACMDGGTSSAMAKGSKLISKPMNGNYQPKTRPIPNAWIVNDK